MPRAVPSQIVAIIDRAFPFAQTEPGASALEQGHAPAVGAVVALVEGLPDGVLMVLSPEEHTTFLAAVATLRTSLTMWQTPAHFGLQHRLGPEAVLKHRHPLTVVRNTLAKCPDDSPALVATDLSFLVDREFENILSLDISTASSALANGEYKAATVIAGSVIEAILLWALKRRPSEYPAAWSRWDGARAAAGQQRPRKLQSDILEWQLDSYIEIGRYIPIISEATASAVTLARGFRNLIHPARAERVRERPTLASAMLAVGAMRYVVDDVRTRVEAGTL